MLTAIAAAWALAAVPASAAPAADAKEVRVVIERTVHSVLDVLKDKGLGKDIRKKGVLAVIDPVFDLPLMGKLTLGRGHWARLDDAQQSEFTSLFVATIKDSYYEKIDLFTDETVDFEEPVQAEQKGKYQMLTRINSKGQRYGLLYKLYKTKAGWKVYDVEIEGISLIRSYGAQYDQFLQKGTVPGLLAKMKQKTLETPGDLKAATKKSAGKTGKP
ncbi:MAG: ABC transporter substrate-binding protein [Elusimicrobia bacterium]|nr:ABC transporter substrate-binding protein [Elusimicrobiota bacterium]